MPGPHLVDDLARRRPDVVGVSCSSPEHLFGARRTIEAATSVGLPVVAGGAGFGRDGSWARTLGASAWAPAGSAIADAAREAMHVGAADGSPLPSEVQGRRLLARVPELVSAGTDRLAERYPDLLRTGTPTRTRTEEDLGSILRFAAAAVLVGDDRLFLDFLDWLLARLVVRGGPDHSVVDGITALQDAAADEHGAAILGRGVRHLSAA